MEKPVLRRDKEVERGKFTVKSAQGNRYVIYSHEYDRDYELTINFIKIKKPEANDELELPDCMLKSSDNRPMFTNRLLQFCEPNDRMAIPQNFNIQLDYAYITYKSTGKTELIQRCYG